MKTLRLTCLAACAVLLIQSCSKNERVLPPSIKAAAKKMAGIAPGFMTGPLPAGTYKFVSCVSTVDPAINKSIGVTGGSLSTGALLEQRDFAGTAQEWRVTATSIFGTNSIINYNSGLSMDDFNASQADNNPIWQYPFNGNAAQQWVIQYQGFGVYRIRCGVNLNMGLHVAGGSTANGANIVLKTFATDATQTWGYFFIYPLPISPAPVNVNVANATHTNSYPRITRLNNGNLLASFVQDTAHVTPAVFAHAVAKFYQSTNGGNTWTALSTLSDTHRSQGIYDPQPFVTPVALGTLPAGTLLCGIRSAFWVSTSYIDVYKSTNGGSTWSYLSSVASGNGFGHNIYEPFFLVDASNRLICYYSDERDGAHSQKLVYQVSTDGGSTWGGVNDVVALPAQGDRPGMFQAAKMGNGKWIMTYEYVGAPNISQVFYKTSTDGVTWDSAVSSPGTGIQTVTGETPGGTPSVVWTPAGSTSGTVIITSLADYPSNPSGSSNIVNTVYGTGAWESVPQPLTYNYTTDNVSGYSRSLGLSADGKTLYHINCVSTNDKNANTVFVATPAW